MEEIVKDVWKIKGSSSIYVILGDVPMVIDAGDREDLDLVRSEIESIIPLTDIRIVLLTHLHYDHVGCVDFFVNADVYADEKEIGDYMKNARKFYFYVDEVDDFLRERLKLLPDKINGLKVLRVPGHTNGSAAFLDERRGILFSGDTIFAGEIIGRTDLPNSLPVEMDESVLKLRKLVENKKLILCPGHGY
jgi:hydroxyacylglutathione hydrolase